MTGQPGCGARPRGQTVNVSTEPAPERRGWPRRVPRPTIPTHPPIQDPRARVVGTHPTLAPARLELAELVALASACGAPRVSLYWSAAAVDDGAATRRYPLARLVQQAEAQLARSGVAREVGEAILAPARALSATPVPLPAGGSRGLLASEAEARLLWLPHAVRPGAWVSGRYRVSPLVPLVRSNRADTVAAERSIVASLDTGRVRLDLPTVLRHARAGELVVLVAALDERAWGRFDALGRVAIHASRQPGDEELVDLTVAYALGRGAEVHVVPKEEVPGGGTVAALARG